jgi:hypothetical protein
VRRLSSAPRAPLAVAGILATPLFFVALMAASLAVEKPSVHHALRHGKALTTFGDPVGRTEAAIWLLACVPPLALVLVGVGAMLAARGGAIISSVSAILLTVALLVPLDGWTRHHTARYPVGVDLIPPSAGSGDIYLRGEWEGTARRTADQLGAATIVIAAIAIAIALLLELRRRRGVVPPLPPPPPAIASARPGSTASL